MEKEIYHGIFRVKSEKIEFYLLFTTHYLLTDMTGAVTSRYENQRSVK